MMRRFIGQQPLSFMSLPWLGEVEPGDVLSGAAAHAVAGRRDFEDVDEADSAEPAVAEVPATSDEAPAEDVPAKSRRPAAKAATGP